jgi:hypothetical protein
MNRPQTLFIVLLAFISLGLAVASIIMSSGMADLERDYDKRQREIAKNIPYHENRVALVRILATLAVTRKDQEIQRLLSDVGIKIRVAEDQLPTTADPTPEASPAPKKGSHTP